MAVNAPIPTADKNPEGLHQKYLIERILGYEEFIFPKGHLCEDLTYKVPITRPTEEWAEYFILRLDEDGEDMEHIKACRVAIHAYADAIQHHLPKLASDIKERYPLLK